MQNFDETGSDQYLTMKERFQVYDNANMEVSRVTGDKSKVDRNIKVFESDKKFSIDSAKRIKEIESITNHDEKAVEYLIKDEFDNLNLSKFKEFIHFGLTSQDINNTAVPLSIKDAFNNIFFPELTKAVS